MDEQRTQRISYAPLAGLDAPMIAELERCAREGTPRPESSAVRAHSNAAFWAFANSWAALFRAGVVDHELKELCRVYVSRSVKCEYCGNQRSTEAQRGGLTEGRQRAALSYAEAITWRLDPDDAFWDRLHRHFTEEELVELAGFICLSMGQQSWIRLLNIDHHQVLAGSSASLAPGLDDAAALAAARERPEYWARRA